MCRTILKTHKHTQIPNSSIPLHREKKKKCRKLFGYYVGAQWLVVYGYDKNRAGNTGKKGVQKVNKRMEEERHKDKMLKPRRAQLDT